ncbi:R3H and coiled-coil domain-containing protein 1 isoform X2 [Pimephales promelas]|uniref:R3H and coiled-coil domain-containing protein 1 isoform X2 n=1 Tax=Pimephales promelas TaxID=90988 RepID=UPI001955699E|nr:R3H and coiled-coil domain-containing protein 1 isoform X2 [Pimephales promelas]KAG1970673.1 coiled-coil domain-containing protein R3HCC1L [Pimephales promelas]KAG1970674.1 coiled-coil domain-containing protein R3HCC1L [Pimephales promelas]
MKSSFHEQARGRGEKMEDECNRRRAKRLEKAIYVPLARRHKANLEESSEDTSSDVAKEVLASNQETEVDRTDQSLADQNFVQLSRSGPSPWPPAWDETVSFFTSLTLDDQAEEYCANNTDPLPTDATLQLQHFDESLLSEIKAKLKCEDITVLNTCNDFPAYTNIWLDPEEFGHVIEIYNFPTFFKTEDLLDAFADYSEGGMKIKWVDNTHALGIFSSQSAATQALSLKHPILKTRVLLEGSQKAKWKAVRRAEFIQPVKERPRTDTAVARRMVTRALGLSKGLKK